MAAFLVWLPVIAAQLVDKLLYFFAQFWFARIQVVKDMHGLVGQQCIHAAIIAQVLVFELNGVECTLISFIVFLRAQVFVMIVFPVIADGVVHIFDLLGF